MECTVQNNKMVTLSSAVRAAIVDKFQDIGKAEIRYSHWAAREYKQIYMQVLPKIKQKAILTINKNTNTATLPLDWDTELFIGGIDITLNKIPLRLNNDLVDVKNITVVTDDLKCPKCDTDTSICNELSITTETSLVVINDNTYEKTITKKLYPNGDYYLETVMPFYDIQTSTVIYPAAKKEFISNFSLKPCGCLEDTIENITTLQNACPDIYCRYYASCGSPCNTSYDSYKIFEESGLIQFSNNFPYDKVYVEYYGFIQKISGQYYIPQVAFETIVEGIKYRAIKNKDNEPRWRILDQKEEYRQVKGNMMKILGRVSLVSIIQAAARLPKFDIDFSYNNWYGCFTAPAAVVAASVDSCQNGSGSGSSVIQTSITQIINRTAFVLAVKAGLGTGHPTPGATSYQNNILKGATDIQSITLAKQTLTILDGDFTFDGTTGTITLSNLNTFIAGDSLIVYYNKTT